MRPELAATVAYAEWTSDGRLRFLYSFPPLDVPAELRTEVS